MHGTGASDVGVDAMLPLLMLLTRDQSPSHLLYDAKFTMRPANLPRAAPTRGRDAPWPLRCLTMIRVFHARHELLSPLLRGPAVIVDRNPSYRAVLRSTAY